MKKLLFAFCMLTFSLGMMAQEDKPKSNWIVSKMQQQLLPLSAMVSKMHLSTIRYMQWQTA